MLTEQQVHSSSPGTFEHHGFPAWIHERRCSFTGICMQEKKTSTASSAAPNFAKTEESPGKASWKLSRRFQLIPAVVMHCLLLSALIRRPSDRPWHVAAVSAPSCARERQRSLPHSHSHSIVSVACWLSLIRAAACSSGRRARKTARSRRRRKRRTQTSRPACSELMRKT